MKTPTPSIIDQLVILGVEKSFSQQEIAAINQELFGEAWKEHERLKAEGRLHEIIVEGEEEEMPDWSEADIQEDNPEVEEIISNALFPHED